MNNNYNNNNRPSGDIMSWVVVILCLVAFWPLGLVLLLRKISFNAKKNATSQSNFTTGQQQRPYNAQQQYRPQQAPPQYRQQQQYRPQGSYQQNAQTPPHRNVYQSQQQTQQQQPPQQQAQQRAYQTQQAYKPQQGYYAQQARQAKQNEKKRNKEKKKNQKGKGLASLLTFLGIVFSLAGVICIAAGLGSAATVGMTGGTLATLLVGAFIGLGGIISFLSRIDIMKRLHRYNKYTAIMGDKELMTVSEMANSAGISPKKLRRDLASMADDGYFGQTAYFDNALDSLCLSSGAAERARTEAKQATERTSTAAGNDNQYVAVINELHMLCGATSDPSICAKISRIEEITAKIFMLVEEKPEKKPQLRRFTNYYLPTTLKLLHSYATLEKQGVKGENITSAKQEIERVLDTLAVGFEQQLDNLFKSDKIDISSDIDVLESMMAQDGLTNEGNILKTSDGGILKTAGGN